MLRKSIFNMMPGNNSIEEALPEITQEEEMKIQSDVSEFKEMSEVLDGDLAAIEEAETVLEEVEDKIIQNEVNMASLDGEEVPAEGEVIQVVDENAEVTPVTEGEDQAIKEDVEVLAEGPAPAPELTTESTPAEIVEKTIEVEGAIESISGLLTGKMANAEGGLNSVLGISRKNISLESALANPAMSYKEACEGLKEVAGGLKDKIKAGWQAVIEFIKNMYKKFKSFLRNYKSKTTKKLEAIKKVNPADYSIKEGVEVPANIEFIWSYALKPSLSIIADIENFCKKEENFFIKVASKVEGMDVVAKAKTAFLKSSNSLYYITEEGKSEVFDMSGLNTLKPENTNIFGSGVENTFKMMTVILNDILKTSAELEKFESKLIKSIEGNEDKDQVKLTTKVASVIPSVPGYYLTCVDKVFGMLVMNKNSKNDNKK